MPISATMAAVVFHGPGDIRVERKPVPEPAADEVLVQVTSAGICGSDVGEVDHGPVLIPMHTPHPVVGTVGPIVLGHEWAGRIVAKGSDVDDLRMGQLVASGSGVSCGRCAYCRQGRTNLCLRYWTLGFQRDGGLAEYVAAPAAICRPVDEALIGDDAAGLTQPLSIATHAVRRGRPAAGSAAATIGAGGIGAFLIAALRALTGVADIFTVEPDAERRRIAKRMGASTTFAPGSHIDRRFETVYEVSGSRAGLAAALELVAAGGTLVLVGLQQPGIDTDLLRQASLRELDLVGTNAHVLAADFPDALTVLANRADWDEIAPTMYPLTDAPSVFSDYLTGVGRPIKALFDPRAVDPRPARYPIRAAGQTRSRPGQMARAGEAGI